MKQLAFLLNASLLLLTLWPRCSFAQSIRGAQPAKPDWEYGKITAADFAPTDFDNDSSTNAVILFDRGEISFDPVSSVNRSYSIVFVRHTRIHILNRNAFNLAAFSLANYRRGNIMPDLEDFRGATYNLENGQVVQTKLDKSGIFKEKDAEKIVFPNVKEGTVIEYTMKIEYPGFQYIPTWSFQGSYPCLVSICDVTVPTLFDYFIKTQGYQPFAVDTVMEGTASFAIGFSNPNGASPYRGSWSGKTIRHIWAQQNIPALWKRELYTTTLANHISKISFQLSAIHADGYDQTFHSNWNQLSDELMKNQYFGADLNDHSRWMDDELQKAGISGALTMANLRAIYTFVQQHIKTVGGQLIYTDKSLKKVWEEKEGNVAGTNLLLTAIYRHEGFSADPVILSTRMHGYAVDLYPILSDYDYVITRLKVGERTFLLDASKDFLGFGQLTENCYNGAARVIGVYPERIDLSPDSLTETRRTTVVLSNTDSGYVGSYRRELGNFESISMRERLKQETPDAFFEGIQKGSVEYKQVTTYGIDSLDKPEEPLAWHYNMKYRFTKNRYYFNPILHERLISNPFSSPERHYPVEMPYRIDNVYTLRMEVPKGYAVDELPKSKQVSMENGGGSFEYSVKQEGNVISLRISIHFSQATFPVGQYRELRDLYALVVNKEKEPFVFKKIE